MCFRPLLGFFIFQWCTNYFEYVPSDFVSVPYWGSLYFNKNHVKEANCHDNVSVPYWGSLYFNFLRLLCVLIRQYSFRPLLGFFIFQCSEEIKPTWKFDLVSVPYWGSLYFNGQKVTYKPYTKTFPSPTGVLYISIYDIAINRNNGLVVSVPYWGSLYFNSVTDEQKRNGHRVSVPYWGSLYFN